LLNIELTLWQSHRPRATLPQLSNVTIEHRCIEAHQRRARGCLTPLHESFVANETLRTRAVSNPLTRTAAISFRLRLTRASMHARIKLRLPGISDALY